MYAENEPAVNRNEAVLNNLPGELYTIEADDKCSVCMTGNRSVKQKN